jgi:CPA1 family monovalent cation:H+ antiporter
MGVIITSLLAASIGLPWLLKGLRMPPEPSHQAEEDAARVSAAHAAIAAVERVQHDLAEGRQDADLYVATAARIMDGYRQRIEGLQGDSETNAAGRRSERIERDLRLAALKAERAAIFRMIRKRELGTERARKLIRELDLLEARYAT